MAMSIQEIIERIPAWYMSSCEKGGPSFHMVGRTGCGKSTVGEMFPQIMKKVDPEGDYGLVIINGLTVTLPWLCGFMELNVNEKTGKKTSSFSLPYWWYTKEGRPIDSYSGGLILIEEEDKMPQEERKLTRDMKLAKRAGMHYLPDNWVVWSNGNPVGSRNGGTKTFDFIINSQVLVEVRDNTAGWVEWAERSKLLPEVITFAENNPHILYMDPPTVQGPYCSPRSLHQADIHLQSCMATYGLNKIPLDPITQGEIAGLIGKGEAEALFQHFRMSLELPAYSESVAFPATVKMPMEPDKLRLFTYKIADYAQQKDAAAIGVLMERMPSEFQFMFVKMVRQRNARMLIEPEFRAWCKKNAQLIALIEGYERDHERRST